VIRNSGGRTSLPVLKVKSLRGNASPENPSPTYLPSMSGRPTALNPELQANVIELVEHGNYRYVAAGAVGISRKTFCEWMKRGTSGRPEDEIYRSFRDAVLAAEKRAEIGMVMQATSGDPKHAQWWLERKFPERWGRDRGAIKLILEKLAALEANQPPAREAN